MSAESLLFVTSHAGALGVLGLSCWGFGAMLLALRARAMPDDNVLADPWLRAIVTVAVGTGMLMALLLLAALASVLRREVVLVLIALGVLLAVVPWRGRRHHPARVMASGPRGPAAPLAWLPPLLLALLIGVTALTALQPPLSWDELMYHLPHAREWARSGHLSVNDWLRYPWFPYGFNLLYSASLLTMGDVFTHVIHAGAGWLVALLCYRLALRHAGPWAGLLAAAAWLYFTRFDLQTAFIDLGLALMVVAALVVCLAWTRAPDDTRLGLALGLLLGSALAIKYQALSFMPGFAVLMLLATRRVRPLATVALTAALVGGYWYARNAWLAGDPVAPMGGRLFGFTDWNAGDYALQFAQLKGAVQVRVPGQELLWLTPLAVLWPGIWRQRELRAMLIWTGCALLFWRLSSPLPRYMLPAYPVLAVLVAVALCQALQTVWRQGPGRKWSLAPRWRRGLSAVAGALVLAVLVATQGVPRWRDQWQRLAVPSQREALLDAHLPCARLARFATALKDDKVYQFAMEYAIYNLPSPVWGDAFGPWRYRDVDPAQYALGLSPYGIVPATPLFASIFGEHAQRAASGKPADGEELAEWLKQKGFTVLLVDRGSVAVFESKPRFAEHFTRIGPDDACRAYRIH